MPAGSRIQLAPANLHWCSDDALTRLANCSRKYGVPLHMHLLETAYQKEYARRRGGGTAVQYIDRFGLLGPQMTLGHGVWLNKRDIQRLAETGTCVCHNCSSNFRLRSGVAALNKLEAAGITTAIGIDEAGINDDRDMLQEMRMVLRAHRVPGMDDGCRRRRRSSVWRRREARKTTLLPIQSGPSKWAGLPTWF